MIFKTSIVHSVRLLSASRVSAIIPCLSDVDGDTGHQRKCSVNLHEGSS